MIDIKEDQRLAALWMDGVSTGTMDSEKLAELAQNGFDYCEGYCGSREYTGSDKCRCIREVFPTYQDYLLYQHARNRFKKYISIGLLAQRISLEKNGDD